MQMAMRRFAFALLALVSFGGCVIAPAHRGYYVEDHGRGRACPPAHHWDGYECVHNGNGHGHGYRQVDDHR